MSGFTALIQETPTIWVSERTDSHSEIAAEFSIRDNGVHRLYAFEFFPDEGNPSPDVSTWTLRWDSDATAGSREKPDEEFVSRIRPLIERKAAKYVFRDGSHKFSDTCRAWVFGSAHVDAHDSSRVVAWGSSSVVARGSSSVDARGSSRVVARDSSTVDAHESSRVVARDSSSVDARGSSSVLARDSSSVVARESSTVDANESSAVVAHDSSSVVARDSSSVLARDSSSVDAHDSSSVLARGSSSVNSYGPDPGQISENAVWIDRRGAGGPAVFTADGELKPTA